jgi:hypothetical protein
MARRIEASDIVVPKFSVILGIATGYVAAGKEAICLGQPRDDFQPKRLFVVCLDSFGNELNEAETEKIKIEDIKLGKDSMVPLPEVEVFSAARFSLLTKSPATIAFDRMSRMRIAAVFYRSHASQPVTVRAALVGSN